MYDLKVKKYGIKITKNVKIIDIELVELSYPY